MSKINCTWEELESFNIKIQKYGDLFSLNYCQIKSPRFNPIADICRGLIVDKDLNIISRSFNRFYNYGEIKNLSFSSVFKVVEKIDGSLIKIYWWNNQWNISTRSNPFGDNFVGDYPFTYTELVNSILGVSLTNLSLDKDYTHIFELVSPYNKIVTDYGKNPKLFYLISRNNQNGDYFNFSTDIKNNFPYICYPQIYNFKSINEVLEKSKNLSNFKEGFVIYSKDLNPILKIKSPNYIIAHKLRGNKLTFKNAIKLFLENEHTEYLSYFPEDYNIFKKLELQTESFFVCLQKIINNLDYSLPDKDYANIVLNQFKEYSPFLFLSKKRNIRDSKVLFSLPDIKEKTKEKIFYDN